MEHATVDSDAGRGWPMNGAQGDGRRGGRVSRRSFLRTAALGSGAVLALGCQSSASPAGQAGAGGRGTPSGGAVATAGPASGGAAGGWEARWNELVEAAKAEGALVISGPPTPEVR